MFAWLFVPNKEDQLVSKVQSQYIYSSESQAIREGKHWMRKNDRKGTVEAISIKNFERRPA